MKDINAPKWLEKLREWLPWVPVVGLLLVISAIPYGWTIYQRVGTDILVLGYFAYYIVYRKWKDIRWTNRNWLYIIMILLYLMFPVRQLFDSTPPTDYFLHQLHRHEWFLFAGLVGILGFSDKLKMRHVAYVMLLTSVVMVAHCAYLYWGTTEYASYAPMDRFDLLRRQHVNSHMVMNLYINGALAFGFCCLREPVRWWKKALVIVAMIIAWGLVLLSDGRIGLAGSLLIVSVGIVYLIFRKNKYWGAACALTAVLIACLIVMQRPRMSVEKVSRDPRLEIWDYSVRMVKEKPVCGYGLSTLSEQYVEQAYQDSVMYYGFVRPIIEWHPEFKVQGKTFNTHHPHNAFLTYWLAVGLLGLLLLAALFVAAAYLPVGENKLFLWLFLLALLLQCMTEPIGDHLLPQFIALMLCVWEKSVPSTPSVRSDSLSSRARTS